MKEDQRSTESGSYLIQMRLHSLILAACLMLLLGLIWEALIPSHRVLAAGNTVTIHITGTAQPPGFRPLLVTVHVDDTIVFLNDAQPAATYMIAADDQSFISPPITPGQQWSITFSHPGTYAYHAQSVPQSLVGLIIVVPLSVKLLPTPAPGVVATEIATLRSGRRQSSGPPPPSSGSSSATVIIAAALVLVLVGLAGGSLLFLHRRRHT